MSELVVEVHVPLVPGEGVPEDEYQYPWIDTVYDFVMELDGEHGEMYDDGEELGDEYVFFVSGATEDELVGLAREIAALPGVPDGVFAVVTDSDSEEMGTGRVVKL
ncbi:glutamyl-tRNA amidotransferase [Demequina aurantiaca]|uniref:glutamyl-tRNA amidotransferase n=1 Tax=Demequina aurantiaca TaxID=676200 RepID=UPI003D33A456